MNKSISPFTVAWDISEQSLKRLCFRRLHCTSHSQIKFLRNAMVLRGVHVCMHGYLDRPPLSTHTQKYAILRNSKIT